MHLLGSLESKKKIKNKLFFNFFISIQNVTLIHLYPFLTFQIASQEINPQTGTRLDCPWPWGDKTPQEDGYFLQQRQQQRSPRFVSRSKAEDLGNVFFCIKIHIDKQHPYSVDVFEAQIIRILTKVHASIDRNEQRLTEHERKEITELEWKQASVVLDRLLLAVFLLITIISTTTILCRSPQEGT